MTRGRLANVVVVSLCGVATGLGGILTWLKPRDGRPNMGMDRTSFTKMLDYTMRTGHPYVMSVGFVVVLLGILILLGGLSGQRFLAVIGAFLALGVADTWIGLATHHYFTPRLPNRYYLNPAHLPWSQLSLGAWVTVCGAALGLLSTIVLRGWNPTFRGALRH
jgi:hypothetical protein